VLSADMDRMTDLLRSGEILHAAERVSGRLR